MIDSKKINLILLLSFIILIFLPPVVVSAILIFQMILIAVICTLRLTAAFSKKSVPLPRAGSYRPFISMVIACANEPAELLALTLDHMSRINYDKYEVLVLDNNNDNKDNWELIKKKCAELGEKFCFVHVDHVDGYKAGALNLANRYVSEDSQILAIVDADYLVTPDCLTKMACFFDDPRIAIVQAPQDYCDQRDNPGLYANYRSFFSTYMTQAQRLDTVTFTGTMGMIRRSLFDEGLRWNEWCITEDTEAGIFIHALGYKGVYLDEPYGKGLMPFSYESLIKQRSRWAFGNMQIILKNLRPILTSPHFLFFQKMGFLTQLVAWIRFDLTLLMILTASAIANIYWPDPLKSMNIHLVIGTLIAMLIVEIIFFLVGLGKKFTLDEKFKALLVHYGLLVTMSYSWVYMLLRGRLGFSITRKTKSQESWLKIFSTQELLMPMWLIFALLVLRAGALDQGWLLLLSLLLIVEVAGIIHLSNNFRRIT